MFQGKDKGRLITGNLKDESFFILTQVLSEPDVHAARLKTSYTIFRILCGVFLLLQHWKKVARIDYSVSCGDLEDLNLIFPAGQGDLY